MSPFRGGRLTTAQARRARKVANRKRGAVARRAWRDYSHVRG